MRYDNISWKEERWETSELVSITNLKRVIDVDTSNGLLMNNPGRMPSAGDEMVVMNLRFLALAIENNRISDVQIYPLNPTVSTVKEATND